MRSPRYAAHLSRLVGPGTTTFFRVEITPSDRLKGQVASEAVHVLVQEAGNAPPERVLAKVRELLASISAEEWEE
jgi:hypothetical protein